MNFLNHSLWMKFCKEKKFYDFLSYGFKANYEGDVEGWPDDFIQEKEFPLWAKNYKWENVLDEQYLRLFIVYFPRDWDGRESPYWSFSLEDALPNTSGRHSYWTEVEFNSEGKMTGFEHFRERKGVVNQTHLARSLFWMGLNSEQISRFIPFTQHELMEWNLERNGLLQKINLAEWQSYPSNP